MKASDLFVRCLEAEGVTHIFGVPGGRERGRDESSLMDSSIRFVLLPPRAGRRLRRRRVRAADRQGRGVPRHPRSRGDQPRHRRRRRKHGPLAGGVHHRPGQHPAPAQGEPPEHGLGRHVRPDSPSGRTPSGTRARCRRWCARRSRPRRRRSPARPLIELPEDIAKEESDETPMSAVKTRRPGADHKVVRQAVDLIAEAKRPIVLAGNGAVRKRAARQLRRFAHKTGIGVVNTFMGKGAVPMSDPHCLFTMGLQRPRLHQPRARRRRPRHQRRLRPRRVRPELLEPRPVDPDHPHRLRAGRDRQPLPRGARHPGRHRRRRSGRSTRPSNHRFDNEGRLPLFDIGERRKLRDAIHDDLTMEQDDASFPMKPQKILWDVRRHLGPDDILLSDVGAHKMWIARYYQCETANTCLISNGFCSMGFALPGAMGAKLAHPDRKVLAIAGDAGFLMNVQDLETLVRYRQNVVVMGLGRRRVRAHQVEAAEQLRRPALRPRVQQPGLRAAGEVVRRVGAGP